MEVHILNVVHVVEPQHRGSRPGKAIAEVIMRVRDPLGTIADLRVVRASPVFGDGAVRFEITALAPGPDCHVLLTLWLQHGDWRAAGNPGRDGQADRTLNRITNALDTVDTSGRTTHPSRVVPYLVLDEAVRIELISLEQPETHGAWDRIVVRTGDSPGDEILFGRTQAELLAAAKLSRWGPPELLVEM